MATTKTDIREWLKLGKTEEEATHVIVVCDTFSYEDYPIFVTAEQNVKTILESYVKGEHPMQRVIEVYDLAKDIEAQMKEFRSFNY